MKWVFHISRAKPQLTNWPHVQDLGDEQLCQTISYRFDLCSYTLYVCDFVRSLSRSLWTPNWRLWYCGRGLVVFQQLLLIVPLGLVVFQQLHLAKATSGFGTAEPLCGGEGSGVSTAVRGHASWLRWIQDKGRTQLVFSFWWWCIRINLGIFRQSCWATLFSKMRSTLTNRWLLSWVCKSHVIHIGHIRSYELRIALCLVTRNWRWTCCQWGLVWKLLPQCGPTRFFFAVPNQFTWVGQSEILAFKRFQQFK